MSTIRSLLRLVLVLSLIKDISSNHQQQLRRVCYFTNWSCDLLVKEAYFCLHDLDASLCSHIIFAFAGVNVTSLSLSPTRIDDESVGTVKGRYVQLNDLKKTHPGLKTLLSAGGSYQADRFKTVTATNRSRERFAYNTARYVRRWGFDGLDLDWEYPGKLEKEALTYLVKDLKSAFREEAQRTGQQELLLSIAVPVGEERVRLGYQVDLISKDADMINLMAYDFYYGAWMMTAFNSPLFPRNHHKFSRKHSVEWIVNLWINLGAPPHKINLGIAGYGQSFTLQTDPHETLPSDIQAGNTTGIDIDQKNHSTAAVLKNSSNINGTTFYNNVSDDEKGNNQSQLHVTTYGQKNIPLCKGNLEECVMEARLPQNINRIKRDSNGIFSHHHSATSHPSDALITSSNSDPAVFSGNITDELSIHQNGIGSQELDSKNADGREANREMLSHGEVTTHRNGDSKQRHADSALSTGDGKQQRDSHAGTYRGNSQPRHGTDAGAYRAGSKAVGPGRPGRLRHLKGQLSYPEICEKIHAGASVAWDQEQRVPYAVLGDQWVGYENPRSVAEKVTWAFEHRLGGIMFWSLDLDDFKGDYCGQGRFPLLTSMSKTVISLDSKQYKSIIGNSRHFTNETSWVDRTDALTTQESRATAVSDNNMENAIERPVTSVTLLNKQKTGVDEVVTTSSQNADEHDFNYNETSFNNATDLQPELEPTDDRYPTNKRTVSVFIPAKAGYRSDVTTKRVAENATHRATVKDKVAPISGKKQLDPASVFPFKDRRQSEPADFLLSNEKNQSEPNDFFPLNEKKQSVSTDFFPTKENKKSEPTDFYPSNESNKSNPTDFFPPKENKKSEPTDFYPSNESNKSNPTDFFPPTENKKSDPTDFYPSNESNKSNPTDFFPSNEKKQPELSNETKQSETSELFPSAENKQLEPPNEFTSEVRVASEINNDDYDYSAFSAPASTVTDETITTTHTSNTDKHKKSNRKLGAKKRLYKNASNIVTASINVVVFGICALFITTLNS